MKSPSRSADSDSDSGTEFMLRKYAFFLIFPPRHFRKKNIYNLPILPNLGNKRL